MPRRPDEEELALRAVEARANARPAPRGLRPGRDANDGVPESKRVCVLRDASTNLDSLVPTATLNSSSGGYFTTTDAILSSCFGWEDCNTLRLNIANTSVVAAGTHLSERTVIASQLVVGDFCSCSQLKWLQKEVIAAPINSCIVVKRTWDTATIYMGVNRKEMEKMFDPNFLEVMQQRREDRARRRGIDLQQASFSVEVFQQEVTVRVGAEDGDIEQFTVSSKIMAGKSADYCLAALELTVPPIDTASMRRLAMRIAFVFFYFYPDGDAVNALLIEHTYQHIPRSLVFASSCLAHNFALSGNEVGPAFGDTINPLYSMACTFAQHTNNVKMGNAAIRLAKTCRIYPGVEPKEEDKQFSDLVLRYTLLRKLRSHSYLRPDDAPEHTPADGEVELLACANRIQTHFNGNWRGPLEHYCCKKLENGETRRMHINDEQCIQEGVHIVREDVLGNSLYGLRKPSKNRWETEEEADSRIAFLYGFHDLGGASLRTSLGHPRRLEKLLTEAEVSGSDVRITCAKRIKESVNFSNQPGSCARVIARNIVSLPISRGFSTVFKAESLAFERVGNKNPEKEKLSKINLLGSLASPTGILFSIQRDLTQMTKDPVHDLSLLLASWHFTAEVVKLLIRESRAAVLRCAADVLVRDELVFAEDPFPLFDAAELENEDTHSLQFKLIGIITNG